MELLQELRVELLQELRVVQTGVQLLTGFLMTLPFQPRFAGLDPFQRSLYVVVLLLSVTAVVLFIAPVGLHRALFQRRSKAGLALVGLVVSLGVVLVVDVALGRLGGILAGSGIAALVLLSWYALPMAALRTVRRAERESGADDPAER